MFGILGLPSAYYSNKLFLYNNGTRTNARHTIGTRPPSFALTHCLFHFFFLWLGKRPSTSLKVLTYLNCRTRATNPQSSSFPFCKISKRSRSTNDAIFISKRVCGHSNYYRYIIDPKLTHIFNQTPNLGIICMPIRQISSQELNLNLSKYPRFNAKSYNIHLIINYLSQYIKI